VVIWYIFAELVRSSEKNLATLHFYLVLGVSSSLQLNKFLFFYCGSIQKTSMKTWLWLASVMKQFETKKTCFSAIQKRWRICMTSETFKIGNIFTGSKFAPHLWMETLSIFFLATEIVDMKINRCMYGCSIFHLFFWYQNKNETRGALRSIKR
jgi:hypothetical protein